MGAGAGTKKKKTKGGVSKADETPPSKLRRLSGMVDSAVRSLMRYGTLERRRSAGAVGDEPPASTSGAIGSPQTESRAGDFITSSGRKSTIPKRSYAGATSSAASDGDSSPGVSPLNLSRAFSSQHSTPEEQAASKSRSYLSIFSRQMITLFNKMGSESAGGRDGGGSDGWAKGSNKRKKVGGDPEASDMLTSMGCDDDGTHGVAAPYGDAVAKLSDGADEQENAEEDEDEVVYEYDADFDPLHFIKSLPPYEECVPGFRRILLPRQTRQTRNRKTLVLDLDETLVHSSLEVECVSPEHDFCFPVHLNDEVYTVYVWVRPGVKAFMEAIRDEFEVVIFTASQKVYAESLLNILDPERKYIRHRLFRDSCVLVEGNYLKDLNVLGRDLKDTIIIDNSPQAFAFQVANGIPIESWFDDSHDRELTSLIPFLKKLARCQDVRPLINKRYKLLEKIARS